MREMRRFKQLMSQEDSIRVFENGSHGILAIVADDDYPYAVPINYYYDKELNRIYFHGAMNGMREEYMGKNVKCSFCVVDMDENDPKRYSTNFRSAIAFGTTRALTEGEEYEKALFDLSKKYVKEVFSDKEIEDYLVEEKKGCLITVVDIDFITGKEAIELVRAKQENKKQGANFAC